MDRWMNNPNVVRIVALLLAVLLWALVQLDRNDAIDQRNPVPNRNQERMISEVQVVPVGLDSETYTLQSLEPSNVNITLKGRARDIDQVNLNRGQSRIVVDLSELEEGKHEGVPIEPIGFPDGVEVEIYPRTATVILEEIVGKEVSVEIELVGNPAPGLVAGDPMIDPGRVLVTLPENELSKVVAVKATLDITGASQEVIMERKVVAVDADGNIVEGAVMSPSVVRVEVPITSPFITVPLPVRMFGEPASGFSIESVKQNVTEVTLFGSDDVLQRYEFYGDLEIDISGIRESTNFSLDIPVEQQLQRVYPEQVNVQVNVVPSDTRTLENIPLLLNGENDQAETLFVEPASGTIEVTLEGAPARLNQVNPENVRAIVDVSNLPPGTYELPVRLNTPQYIRYAGGSPLTVSVQIRQDGEEDEPTDADETGTTPIEEPNPNDVEGPDSNDGDEPDQQTDSPDESPPADSEVNPNTSSGDETEPDQPPDANDPEDSEDGSGTDGADGSDVEPE